MPLEIIRFTLGAIENNTYLLADAASGDAAVVDPSFEVQPVAEEIARRGFHLAAVWLTHAHFDHIAGIGDLLRLTGSPAPIALHPADLPLYRDKGGSRLFGMTLEDFPEPSLILRHGAEIQLGAQVLQIRHVPGHTPGHVLFYAPDNKAAFCGDLIFYRGVGRTDLPGGSFPALETSIREQVYTLPGETRLLAGHGPETSVEAEMRENPFVAG